MHPNGIQIDLRGRGQCGAGQRRRRAAVGDRHLQPSRLLGPADGGAEVTRKRGVARAQGERVEGEGSEFGLGDFTYQAFFSPAKPGKVIWGAGPAFVFPTNTDNRLGVDKWSAGPALVALAKPGPWLVGALVQNVWSYAGDSDAPDVNFFSFQYFINYNFEGGWYLTSTPTITANWEADDSGDIWTVPFGGGVGRLVRLGKLPVDFKLQVFYNVHNPDFGPDWTVQLQLKTLFPR